MPVDVTRLARFRSFVPRGLEVALEYRRQTIPIHIVATGSSALRVTAGLRESLAGRFERITLSHWSASSLANVFQIPPDEAASLIVQLGSYPGAMALRNDLGRWAAYIKDAIIDPAIGRDALALGTVRRPGLLRQVFAAATGCPAQIVSLQKLQGQLHDKGALETVAHYLALLRRLSDSATGKIFPTNTPSSCCPS